MVNYPHQISRKIKVRPKNQNRVDLANRGMSFESAINATNDYYLSRGLLVIHKKPSLFKLSKSIIPNATSKIVEAYFRQASTTGLLWCVHKGYYIDFEAKETRQRQPCL